MLSQEDSAATNDPSSEGLQDDSKEKAEKRPEDWTDIDDADDDLEFSRKIKVDPEEAEDYDEWRSERRARGRKRRSKRSRERRRPRGDEDD